MVANTNVNEDLAIERLGKTTRQPQGIGISSDAIVLIPARLASSRLPDKPLAPIGDAPMIVHVWRQAVAAEIGEVVVACAERKIADAIEGAGGRAVLPAPDLPSGTDRVKAALDQIDPDKQVRRVVNLQGDLPDVPPAFVRAVLEPIDDDGADIGTLVVATDKKTDRGNQSVVKAAVAFSDEEERCGRALYFSRATIPSGEGSLLHHIGVYGFSRPALDRFTALPPSRLERRERLEQLRALEANMTIGVRRIPYPPLEVNDPEDLDLARERIAADRGAVKED
ncbi:MAG: 3-deoxy-manno-octulosonate cytidylyltransferase [Geminicoccaceae bacterium]